MNEKRKIEKIAYNGDVYYIVDGNIVDEYFIALPENILAEVACDYYAKIDYKSLAFDEVREFLKNAKNNHAYGTAYRAAKYFLEEADLSAQQIKSILPIYTSICREMGNSDKAIECAERYISQSGAYCSTALLTSLAAAYCDKGEYTKARTICNRAYAMQGGGVGYSNELSLVYKRIKRALGEDD